MESDCCSRVTRAFHVLEESRRRQVACLGIAEIGVRSVVAKKYDVSYWIWAESTEERVLTLRSLACGAPLPRHLVYHCEARQILQVTAWCPTQNVFARLKSRR